MIRIRSTYAPDIVMLIYLEDDACKAWLKEAIKEAQLLAFSPEMDVRVIDNLDRISLQSVHSSGVILVGTKARIQARGMFKGSLRFEVLHPKGLMDDPQKSAAWISELADIFSEIGYGIMRYKMLKRMGKISGIKNK